MHVEYQISKSDYVKASWLASRKSSLHGALRFYFLLIFAGMWISVSAVPIFLSRNSSDLAMNLVFLSVGCVFLYAQFAIRGMNFGREYEKATQLHSSVRLDADAEGARIVSHHSDFRATWSLFSGYCESKSSFLLLQKGNQGFVCVPKRELAAVQIDELRGLFAAYLPRK